MKEASASLIFWTRAGQGQSMAEVQLDNVTKIYPSSVRAVAECNLTIPDGQCTVLIGPSGCGKTTMLRMIAGLESPTSGTIRIGDRVVNDVPPRDRNVAMVFQDSALYPHMSVERNLRFPLERRRETRWWHGLLPGSSRERRRDETAAIDEKVRNAAAQVAISECMCRLPRELSGGERQRVGLGRAIVREPDVLLLDEPLSNLDAHLRLAMRTELQAIHHRIGTTVVHVTHDQEEAMALGDVLVVMKDGWIHQIGTPDEIYRHPADRFVASFIGAPQMNMIQGSVQSGRFHADSGAVLSAPSQAADGPAVLGIRPESIELTTGSGEEAIIEGIERFGDRMDVHIKTLQTRMTARCEASPLRVGDVCTIRIADQSLHLFDVDAKGRRIGV